MYSYYNYKDVGFYESDGREFWNPLLIAEDLAEVLPVNNQNISIIGTAKENDMSIKGWK